MIQIDTVSKLYVSKAAAVRALHDISFEVKDGEFVSVLGPSGCGKSTLLSIVGGLLPASQGTVRIDGNEVLNPQTQVGMVFQTDVLLEWRTTLENVLLQTEARPRTNGNARERARELLDSIGLEGFEDSLPHHLSGGMRQRVALCRALIHDPPILLMDEPFGALDAITRDQMGMDLLHLWDEHPRTAILVTHSIPEAVFLSDRVVVMTPRPGEVADIININIPRPRSVAIRQDPEFLDGLTKIREIFLRGGVLHE